VPAASVLTGPDGAATVMLIGPDNRAHQTPVKVGVRDGDRVQIVDGVAPGAKVIVAGAYGLPDKTKVTVEAANEPAEKKPAAGSQDKDDDKKDDKKD
jgi:multidrug efflux pump subunit AcrA (membrane-fusion protein)